MDSCDRFLCLNISGLLKSVNCLSIDGISQERSESLLCCPSMYQSVSVSILTVVAGMPWSTSDGVQDRFSDR